MVNGPEDASGLGGRGMPLTAAERAVLAILARGVSVGEAADALGWPERAVSVHLVSAGRKLGARSGLETLLFAVRRGAIRRPVLG